MATSTPPTDTDSLAVLHALSHPDLSPEDAYNAVEGIRHMAGHAIIATLDAHKAALDAILEAHRAALVGKIDAHKAALDAYKVELATLRWVVGIGLAGLGALMTLLRLFA